MSTLKNFAIFYPVNAGTPLVGLPASIAATDWWDARVRFTRNAPLVLSPADPRLLVIETDVTAKKKPR